MKNELILLVSVMTLIFQTQNLKAQWVLTPWPVGCCYDGLQPVAVGQNLFLGSYTTHGRGPGGYGGIILSTDFGANWSVVNDSLTPPLFVIGGSLIACGNQVSNQRMFLSSNKGMTWIAAKDSGLPASFAFVGFASMGTDLYAVVDNYSLDVVFQIYRSTDSGTTWRNVSPPNVPQYNTLGSLSVFGSRLLVLNQGRYTSGIYSSSDSGLTWSEDTSGSSGAYPNTMTSCESNIFVAGYDGVYRSTDTGTSWSQVAAASLQVASFIVIDTNVFAATYGSGVCLTSNFGKNWSSHSAGLPSAYFTMGVCRPYLFVADDSLGVYRRSLSEFTGTDGVPSAPQQAQTFTIYPNPVSQEATINFSSNVSSSPANVTIFNLLGVEIAQLYDGMLGVGNHSFTWNTSGASPGAYVCVLRMNGQVSSMPLVLTK